MTKFVHKKITRSPYFNQVFKERIKPNQALIKAFLLALNTLQTNQSDETLKSHELKSKMVKKRAFSVTEDIRVIYKETEDKILLIDIGSHKQVYKTPPHRKK